MSETQQRWEYLLNIDQYKTSFAYIPDTALLTTTWNQDAPYNRFLPEIGGEKTLAGCVNIAMGQIMKYHQHPAAGAGVAYSRWNDQDLKAVLYRPYNWQNMPAALDAGSPEYQVDEVARLIRDLGIANHTDFGLSESSTIATVDALVEHFGYAKEIASLDNADPAAFFAALKGEIDASRPVLLSFPGHMTVADGYTDDGTGKTFHVNMGWGGHDDDYYYLDATVVTVESGYEFSPDLSIFTHIMPCSGDTCAGNLEPDDMLSAPDIAGRFDYARDVDRYAVYLKGATTLSGSRPGIVDQGFFLSVYDADNIRLVSGDDAISHTFAAGRYTVRAALYPDQYADGQGVYLLGGGSPDYAVAITTEALSDPEKTAADAGLDIPPVIYNAFTDRLLNVPAAEALRIVVDARDENGDPLRLGLTLTNPEAVSAQLSGNVLSLSPVPSAAATASRVILTAVAGGRAVESSFIVMLTGEETAFGKQFSVGGLFDSQDDFNTHRVILDGACTVSGDNGYLSQAFFSSVLDSGQTEIVSPVAGDIAGTFAAGIYFLGASLVKTTDEGVFSFPDDTNPAYTLTVVCESASEAAADIAALLSVDLDGTGTAGIVQGDLTGDGEALLGDAIVGLQVLSGMAPAALAAGYPFSGADVDLNWRPGSPEVIYILQKISGLR